MGKPKIYKCVMCQRVLTEYKPIRLTKELYGEGNYKQYYPVKHFDFCKTCYKKLCEFIKENRGVKNA